MIINYIKTIGIPIVFLLLFFLIDPYGWAIEAGYLMVLSLLLFKGKKLFYAIDKDFLVIFFFSATYSIFVYFGNNKGIQYLIIQTLFPAFFYVLGKFLIIPKLKNKHLVLVLIFVGFIYSITIILSTYKNLAIGGFLQTDRFIPSFWNGSEIKATKAASYLIYTSVFPAIIVANRKRLNLLEKLVISTFFVLSLVASFRLGSRTLIVISIVSLLAALLYIFWKQNLKDNLKLVISLAIIAIALYIYVPFDLDSPVFSTLGHRLQNPDAVENTATAGNRTELWADGLENLFKSPLGWKYHMNHHNLWLDIAKEASFIPLLFFLVHNVLTYFNLKELFKNSKGDIGLNVTFLLYILSTYLLFFTEPVIEGNFFSIVFYCLIVGVLKRYNENAKYERMNAS